MSRRVIGVRKGRALVEYNNEFGRYQVWEKPEPKPLDVVPVPAPLHTLADVDWYGKRRPRRGAANPAVDRLLAKLGVRVR